MLIARHGLTMQEAGRTTLREYKEYTTAYLIQRQEQDRVISLQSWKNQMVQGKKNTGTKKNPKYEPIFETFEDFYDETKAFNAIFEPEKVQEQMKKDKPLTLADKNRLLNQVGKEETNG